MKKREIEVLRLVSSPRKFEICDLLRKGVDHPDDIARRLRMSRQSTDKHLLALHRMGIVERSAIFPADGRPRIVYSVGSAAGVLLDRIDETLRQYSVTKLNEFKDSLGVLDDELSSGKLDEQVYKKRRRSLEARFSRYLDVD